MNTASGRPGHGRSCMDGGLCLRHRPEKARARARRRGGDHRRQPPAPLRRRSRPCQSLGGVPVPVYRTRWPTRWPTCSSTPRRRSPSSGPGAGRQSHFRRRSAAKLQRIIYDEDRGLATYDPARLHSFKHVQASGARRWPPIPAPSAGGSMRSPRARARTSA
jgi:hypothetical protein